MFIQGVNLPLTPMKWSRAVLLASPPRLQPFLGKVILLFIREGVRTTLIII